MPARNAGLSSQAGKTKQFKLAGHSVEIFPGDDY